ncbi:hypothetical protein AB4Z54_27090, partial [Streptomyces sp. MCAF7]
ARVDVVQEDIHTVAVARPRDRHNGPGTAVGVDSALLTVDGVRRMASWDSSVVLSGKAVYEVDHAGGTMTPLRAAGLSETTTSRRIDLSASIGDAVSDGAGNTWLHIPNKGQVVRLRDNSRTVQSIGAPGHDVLLLGGGGRAVAVDRTARAYTVLSASGHSPEIPLTLGSAAGDRVVSAGIGPEGRLNLVVSPSNSLLTLDLGSGRPLSRARLPEGRSHRFGSPVEQGGRVWVPALDTGRVLMYERASGRVSTVARLSEGPAPELTVFVRGEWVWANDPAGPRAMVAHDGRVRVFRKYPETRRAPGAPPHSRCDAPARRCTQAGAQAGEHAVRFSVSLPSPLPETSSAARQEAVPGSGAPLTQRRLALRTHGRVHPPGRRRPAHLRSGRSLTGRPLRPQDGE